MKWRNGEHNWILHIKPRLGVILVPKLGFWITPDSQFTKSRFLNLKPYLELQILSKQAQTWRVDPAGISESKSKAILLGSWGHKKMRFLKFSSKITSKFTCAFLMSCTTTVQLVCIQTLFMHVQNFICAKKPSFLVKTLFQANRVVGELTLSAWVCLLT